MIGAPVERVDGVAKVTGAARYSYEEQVSNVAYGVIVDSTITAGRIAAIDAREAQALPGVLLVMTHENAPRVNAAAGDRKLQLLQTDAVFYDRQPVALVVADSFETATDAASRVVVSYDRATPATTMSSPGAVTYTPATANQNPPDTARGDFDGSFAGAAVKLDHTYVTPTEFHNPMEPHATLAFWTGDQLTVFDASQGVFSRRTSIAKILGIPDTSVRVVAKFIGGGFGSKGGTNPHQLLAAMAAKVTGRPVKIVLTRPQMFGGFGNRPRTEQRVRLGARRDGKLIAMAHDVRSQGSRYDDFIENCAVISRMLYAVPNQITTHRGVRYDVVTPTYMRAPGESSGSFALESAMDELAYACGIDPLQLRLINYAEIDQSENKPFSSKSLRQCYVQAAERFGWSKRTPEPGSMRTPEGLMVGYGMASSTYPSNRSSASAMATMHPDGTVFATSGGVDIGTGAYTAFTQVAAEAIGVPVAQVRFDLGDTTMPAAPQAGGSQLTASVANAVHAAGVDLRDKLAALATGDARSPLHGRSSAELAFGNGRVFVRAQPALGETYATIVRRSGQSSLTGRADVQHDRSHKGPYSSHAFGAHFAEVHVDPDLGTVRLTRMVSAFAAGRIVNARTARSQYMGGAVWGVSMALHEEARPDLRSGRYMNANLENYLVPVNADIPAIDIILVDEQDDYVNPLGIKGIGEIGNVGSAAAVANAVYHATGKRVRELPITPEKLLA
ncbi:MAG TPA: xanthine dehydrogenase family protein molybdopterin-binding subunit [Candidatus Elarobacter sp.]|jgi:xanthine dehydrogenase YagR molybdenum-binding subunit|nr:xanthine dehydrogenase family protein molybdopterin-binding subunit [Candidatus Elarobacter sp.]